MKSYKTKQNEIINFLQDSDIEYGSNDYGRYIKMANGFLMCFGKVDIEANQQYGTWTFPHSFLNDEYIIIGNRSWWHGAYGNITFGNGDKNSCTVYVKDEDYGTSLERAAKMIAIGRWK